MNDSFPRCDQPLEQRDNFEQGKPEKEISFRSYLVFFALLIATLSSTYLAGGLYFSISLVLILGAHEFGHYWASRRNNVRVSLPYFIPAPPIFLAGTFGAFIKIKDPIPNRRVLMEIGASGPIAGFIVAVPTLIFGLVLSHVSTLPHVNGINFGSSIILQVLTKLILGVSPQSADVNIELHPLAFAGWLGLFVTALNLLPIGQLDGGHIFYSLFRRHYDVFAKLFLIILLPLGYFWAGWLFWVFLIMLFGFKHPPLIDETILLEKKHRIIGYVSIFIFVVTFIPVPFELF